MRTRARHTLHTDMLHTDAYVAWQRRQQWMGASTRVTPKELETWAAPVVRGPVDIRAQDERKLLAIYVTKKGVQGRDLINLGKTFGKTMLTPTYKIFRNSCRYPSDAHPTD